MNQFLSRSLLGLAVGTMFCAGCAKTADPPAAATPPTSPDAQSSAGAPGAAGQMAVARATLAATRGNRANGSLEFSSGPSGAISVTGNLTGLSPNGVHGFHVHEKGDCSAPDASSAGEHFNPDNRPHGEPTAATHHAGDMTNLTADAQGAVQVSVVLNGPTMRDGGTTDIVGKSVIVHEKRDDYQTQPSGDSGGHIACGVIE